MAARALAEATLSGQASAIGWTPMYSLMMNSMRARPTPSLGSIAVWKASSGLPRLTMISVRGRGTALVGTRVDLERQLAVVDLAGFALGAGHGDDRSGRELLVAPSAPTTAGTPSSRATIAAWQVRPPRLVTIAAAVFITGSQSGVVVSATSTSPGLKRGEIVLVRAITPHRARRRSSRRPRGP